MSRYGNVTDAVNGVGVVVFSSDSQPKTPSPGKLIRYDPFAPPPKPPTKKQQSSPGPRMAPIPAEVSTNAFSYGTSSGRSNAVNNESNVRRYGLISPAVQLSPGIQNGFSSGSHERSLTPQQSRSSVYSTTSQDSIVLESAPVPSRNLSNGSIGADYAQIHKEKRHLTSVDSAIAPLDAVLREEENQYESVEELTSDEERTEVLKARRVSAQAQVLAELSEVHRRMAENKSYEEEEEDEEDGYDTPIQNGYAEEHEIVTETAPPQEILKEETSHVTAAEPQCSLELPSTASDEDQRKYEDFVRSLRISMAQTDNRLLIQMEGIYLENPPEKFLDSVPKEDKYGLPLPQWKINSEAKQMADEQVAKEERKLWEEVQKDRQGLAEVLSMM